MAETRTVEPKVIDVRRWHETRADQPPRVREEYEIALPDDSAGDTAWELVLATPRTEFTRRVTVSGAGEDQRPRLLVEDAPLVRIAGSEHTRVPLPGGVRGTITVVIAGDETDFVEPRFTLESRRTLGPGAELSAVGLAPVTATSNQGTTVLEVERPAGLVPEMLRIGTDTPSFGRRVTVGAVRRGTPDVRLGGGRILRVGPRTPLVQPDIDLAPAHGARLRVEIVDGDSPPLGRVRLSALLRQRSLLIVLPPNGDAPAGTLRFGGGSAAAPHHDLPAPPHAPPPARRPAA